MCTAFFGGSPLLPVWRGEISCRWLGVAAPAFDRAGRPVQDQEGEFVVTAPVPSVPRRLGRPAGGVPWPVPGGG